MFQVDGGVTASISGLTISGGKVETFASGGGVLSLGEVTLTDCTVSGNSFHGVAIQGGTAVLTGCTVSGNTSNGSNGVYIQGGTATLTNCTVSGNSSRGVYLQNGTATLINCTVSGNSVGVSREYGTATLANTIVAGNTFNDLTGDFISLGNNLIGVADGSSGLIGSDLTGTKARPLNAGLAPLGAYGGPTQTMPELYGSPAIGAGNIDLVPAALTTDQRGEPRLFDGKVDIGAYQLQVIIAPSFVVDTTVDYSDPGDGKTTLREAIASANALPGQAITWDSTVFAGAQTITLAGAALELSDTSGTEAIAGPAAGLTISGGGLSRVFQVDPGVTASFAGLTITGGNAGVGGGLYNSGTATLTGCTVSGNSTTRDGGGLFTAIGAATVLTDCMIGGNYSRQSSGGLSNNGTTTLTDCTISGNSATSAAVA